MSVRPDRDASASSAASAASAASASAAAAASSPAPLRRATSEGLYARACERLPGGVSSPVRAFKAVGGTPLFIRRGEGAVLEDVDGNRFLDFCMSWGPLALGHAHPRVVQAVQQAVKSGLSFGAPVPGELELAERIARLHPVCEKVRFVSSGTEAVMSAVRLARGVTGRPLVVKFDGCYHGHADYLLVKAGSGLATAGQPDSAGVPEPIASTTVVLPLDDERALDELIAARGAEIAAILIEPVPANAGLLVQRPAFLEALRAACDRSGALLIFDEVITGFRLGAAGATGRFGVTPDIVTFGKVIGGGMPVGAYGASKAIMGHVAPDGPVYQAGTLSGNPIAMAAGNATLEVLEAGGFEALEERGARVGEALTAAIAEAAPVPLSLVRVGSIFWLAYGSEAPRAWHQVDRAAAAPFYAKVHDALLRRGVYWAPSAFEVGFASTAHDDDAIARAGRALRDALAELARG